MGSCHLAVSKGILYPAGDLKGVREGGEVGRIYVTHVWKGGRRCQIILTANQPRKELSAGLKTHDCESGHTDSDVQRMLSGFDIYTRW